MAVGENIATATSSVPMEPTTEKPMSGIRRRAPKTPNAPMPMVTSTGPLEADDQISVSITESNQSVASDQTDGGSGDSEFPLGLVSLGFVAIIAIGLAAYRYL